MFGFSLAQIIVRVIVLLLGIPIHEWAHAWSAYQLGDDTASLQGRLTLNPLAHLDPVGSLLILVSGFGWGKPVPVNPYHMRINPRIGMALSSAAGPAANFVLAMLLAIPLRLGWVTWFSRTGQLLEVAIQINIGLMLFNLLPAFPLDGEKVLVGVLPPRWGDRLLQLRPFGSLILVALLFVLPQLIGIDLVGMIIAPIYGLLMNLLLFV
ncbi:MAG TPA: site-2 protease family protein [Chloroflexi bacterium]|nr:site-2 protease family protein [Chloroflexota bacterium]